MGIPFNQWHDAREFSNINTKTRLTIAMDGDEAGCKAGFTLATRAYKHGFDVSMMQAPKGRDFNDFLYSQRRAI
ncbi:toprim domain-containing protein [Bartonella jaculi]|uniref:Toprim domain-containing protein n=1 Tax=Bartonella jaculi TaxID=686226 RepID=A0ABP9N017_9HYPH